jgi:DNA-binding ferritin-like protein
MYKTKIDLSDKVRRNVAAILNDRLAYAIDLQSQVKQGAAKRSKLKNYPLSVTAGRDHLHYLSTQLSVYGKYLWFVEAHLQDKA